MSAVLTHLVGGTTAGRISPELSDARSVGDASTVVGDLETREDLSTKSPVRPNGENGKLVQLAMLVDQVLISHRIGLDCYP